MRRLPFQLVDVFAREPLTGNGLSAFLLEEPLPVHAMQRITREMRQFETIFLRREAQSARFDARIFTMEEELPFAGHPVIGAAALMHAGFYPQAAQVRLDFAMRQRVVSTLSCREDAFYVAEMDQGVASFEPPIPAAQYEIFAKALNLSTADLAADLPLQVVSTGLPYLIVPIESGLEDARIVVPDFEPLLATVGAKFVYVFHTGRLEGRTWDNDGSAEDIATGSAAGPTAAYLVRHGRAAAGRNLVLAQGRFVGRPSEIHATVEGDSELRVAISGRVCPVGRGTLSLPAKSLQPLRTEQ